MGVLQGLVSNKDGYLYAAWKGEPDDDRIFYSRWNGQGKWASSGTIPGNTSVGPALGVFNGSVYAAWKGEWSDPRLFFSKFDGTNWDAQEQIPNVYSDTGPALSSLGSNFGGHLVAAWKNLFDQNLYFATFDGTRWSSQSQIGGVASSIGPSLATLPNGKVYAVWKGSGSDQSLWWADFDGTSWSGQTQIPGVGSSVGASLAAVGTKLYAVWKGEGFDERLWYAVYDGTSWSGQNPVGGGGSSIGAAIAQFNGNLYAMYKGADTDASLYTAEWNGAWSGFSNSIPGNTGPDPTTLLAAPTQGNTNYAFADSNGASLIGATVTIIVAEDIVPDNLGDFSFQINCKSPAQPSTANPFVWQQYFFVVTDNEICTRVNCFRQQDIVTENPYLNWDSRPPRMPQGKGTVALSNNTLPKGTQLTLTIATNGGGAVDGFSFSIAVPGQPSISTQVITLQSMGSQVATDNLAPIISYQAILVAKLGGDTQNFSSGQAIFQFYENNNLVATPAVDESGENSNTGYGSLPASYPNGEFYQPFGIGLS